MWLQSGRPDLPEVCKTRCSYSTRSNAETSRYLVKHENTDHQLHSTLWKPDTAVMTSPGNSKCYATCLDNLDYNRFSERKLDRKKIKKKVDGLFLDCSVAPSLSPVDC